MRALFDERDVAPTAFFGSRPGTVNCKRAITSYTKAIDLNPKLVKAYDRRGSTYHALGDYQKAIEDYTKIITLDPYIEVYYARGLAYYKLHDYQKAIKK